MRVNRLKITNVRAIAAAEFHFRPDFNLVVGVNGIGKTTVLDALSACLAEFVFDNGELPPHPTLLAKAEDVRAGAVALDVECELVDHGRIFVYSHHKSRDKPYGPNTLESRSVVEEPDRAVESVALGVLFATNRAVSSRRAPTQRNATAGLAAALAGAFSPRELRLGEFAHWMRAQTALSQECATAARVLKTLEETVTRFLPDYRNLRVDDKDGTEILIDRGEATLVVGQLSDGERGVLALVLDVTRRLSQANPEMENPTADAEAVVLIDELELHLHPRWQREIVRNLTTAFPRCQFVATTHSPQVIGEVEHDRIHVMTDSEVYSPTHSFGVDSSRVLEEIMDTEPRSAEIAALISRISQDAGEKLLNDARQDLERLADRLGENDPDVTHLRTFIDLVEGDK